ncbi:VP1 [Gokushovirus WZ-2015a]|nr:VP1 [Gokushovirus WZ-2015a]
MNRNTTNHFAQIPKVQVSRSKFIRNHDHKTTFNAGDLIPIYVDEVLPGDTKTIDMAALVRMTTPVFPVMDNAYMDVYFFSVPNRILWEHWRELMGENRTTAWEQTVEYNVPQTTAPAGGWTEGTIADYMGIPTKVENLSVSSLPFRAYTMIWNEWFRDQNLKEPAMVTLDDKNTQGANSGDYVSNAEKGALPLKAAKLYDYFTGALPNPQKGPDVGFDLNPGKGLVGIEFPANITYRGETVGIATSPYAGLNGHMTNTGNNDNNQVGLKKVDETFYSLKFTGSTSEPALYANWPTDNGNKEGYVTLTAAAPNTNFLSINQLRMAFQIQKLYERDARGGTRYRELIRSHFGVTTSDARMQIPEYLGGYREPINVMQVVQTSGTEATGGTPQGNVSAYSVTSNAHSCFTKSFEEHGWVIGVAVVRTDQTYQQGLNRMWSRKNRFDFYWPALANIGEQPILNKEIYAQGTATDNETFGFQEAWAEYRYSPSRVSGLFRSNANGTLDSWHYAQNYKQLPKLSSDWIDQGKEEVYRTLAVQDEPQFLADFYFKCADIRPMPTYSVPGLIDHN